MPIKIHLITSCSSTRLHTPTARVQDLPSGLTNAQAVAAWNDILQTNKAITTPREQYRGQGFMTLLKILNSFTLQSTHIITGGLGFTDIDEPIVPYDFSASIKEEHNIQQKVTAEPFALNVWWSLINKVRHKTSTPLADFMNNLPDDEFVLIGCSKLFLKYIAQDFLSASDAAKLRTRILLTSSSVGSVPVQLRPYIVSFDRSSVNHIPGNRNDVNHRAIEVFLSNVQNPEDFSAPVYEQTSSVFGSGNSLDPATNGRSAEVVTYIKNNSFLLRLSQEEAYRQVYKVFGPIGGRQKFGNVHQQLRINLGLDTVENHDADSDALDVMQEILKGMPSKIDESDENLKTVAIFVDALKQFGVVGFDSSMFDSWMTKYFERKGLKIPDVFSNAVSIFHFILNNQSKLGLVQEDKKFKIVNDEEETENE